jgi:hypothetical protein
MSGFLSEDRPVRKLAHILDRLKATYCGSIGYEYMHIMDRDKCNWLRERIESAEQRVYSKARKVGVAVCLGRGCVCESASLSQSAEWRNLNQGGVGSALRQMVVNGGFTTPNHIHGG